MYQINVSYFLLDVKKVPFSVVQNESVYMLFYELVE